MNELGLARVAGLWRRRKIPMLAAAVAVLGIALAVLSQVDPSYRAQAIVRAGEVQPAREYVPPTVAEQLGERLKSMRLLVMSRPIVTRAATELDLFRHYPKKSHDEVVDEMRERMDVKLEGEDTFLLSYTDSTPERAKAVVDHVAALFMKESTERRQTLASATVTALRQEVDKLAPELALAERAVREFKLAHYGALPEEMEANLRALDQTTMELNIQSTNVDMDEERRRTMLSQARSPLRTHEEVLAGELYEARTKYTDDNPEVRRIAAEWEQVKKARIVDEHQLADKVRHENPELGALERQIARSRSILDGLQKRKATVQGRVEATAQNGQTLAGLVMTKTALEEKQRSTTGRLRDAELAQRLEEGLGTMRFSLVEGAALPSHASSPQRPLLAGLALLAALLAAIGLGALLDAADTTVRDPAELHTLVPEIPLFAAIPHARTQPGKPGAFPEA